MLAFLNTCVYNNQAADGGLAQLVRALASHARGHWFESSSLHQKKRKRYKSTSSFSFWYGIQTTGLERRLLATCRGHVPTAVAFPQKSESIPARSAAPFLSPPKNKRGTKVPLPFLFGMVFRLLDSKGGTWRHAGDMSQPPWLFRRKASPSRHEVPLLIRS